MHASGHEYQWGLSAGGGKGHNWSIRESTTSGDESCECPPSSGRGNIPACQYQWESVVSQIVRNVMKCPESISCDIQTICSAWREVHHGMPTMRGMWVQYSLPLMTEAKRTPSIAV